MTYLNDCCGCGHLHRIRYDDDGDGGCSERRCHCTRWYQVERGQIWVDGDKRYRGKRVLRVEHVAGEFYGYVLCTVVSARRSDSRSIGRSVRISRQRLRPPYYRLQGSGSR